MTRDELTRIRFETYTLWYNSTDTEEKSKYKRILDAVDYAIELKYALRAIHKLGADHI